MRILILGGDGFCGWPTSLHLSASGHDVAIVDNLARRKADVELEAESLTPIYPGFDERLRSAASVPKAATSPIGPPITAATAMRASSMRSNANGSR